LFSSFDTGFDWVLILCVGFADVLTQGVASVLESAVFLEGLIDAVFTNLT
jgi:hypothetical protein